MPLVVVVQVKMTLSPSVGVALSALTLGVAGLSEEEREQAQPISFGLLQRLLHTTVQHTLSCKEATSKQSRIQFKQHMDGPLSALMHTQSVISTHTVIA